MQSSKGGVTMIGTEPNMSKSSIAPLIGLIVMTAFDFLAAAVIHFRLLPDPKYIFSSERPLKERRQEKK